MSQGRVLIVDDKPVNLELLRVELEDAGFEVEEAGSGEACLQRLHEGPLPECLILDIKMPGLSGIEVCRQLKADPVTRHVPVLFLTSHAAGDDTAVAALEAGGNDFLTKPYSAPVLRARVSCQVEIFRAQERLRQIAMTDDLTGLYSRRFLFEATHKYLRQEGRRQGANCVSCLMIDVDHFKKINDALGHLAGDGVLRKTADQVRSQTRRSDIVARFGGEEFAVILPATTLEGAAHVAEKIRTTIAEDTDQPALTVSIGVAAYELPADERALGHLDHEHLLDTLFRHADAALYKAKDAGRNCVVNGETVKGEGVERRRAPRLGIPVTVTVRSPENATVGETADLSTGGAALVDPSGLSMGETVELAFDLDGQSVQVTATVVWLGEIPGHGMRCGVAFDRFEGDGRQILSDFLRDAGLV